ncbi:MAG: hypothetical protein P1U88_11360 [Thalassobaculaceae bacterium]|nr:hypothetical protein [Thalassobaculaceae bacterium]
MTETSGAAQGAGSEPPAFKPALFAVYDLASGPVTFDVMNFLVFANMWTLRTGAAGYNLVFVAGPGGQFRMATPKDKALDPDEKVWRLRHVMASHAYIGKRCLGVSTYHRREDFAQMMRAIHPNQIFPPQYTLEKPRIAFMLPDLLRQNPTPQELDTFEPHPAALRKVDAWLAERAPRGRPVTFTLRTSTIEASRNSNTPAWLEAARRIRDRGFDPVLLPDTDLVTRGHDTGVFGDIPTYGIGAVDLELRVALYRRGLINMADNGGPAFINYFMAGSSAVCFLPVDKLPEVVQMNGGGVDRMAKLLGVPVGGDFPGSTPRRRFVWQPDTVENIMAAFDSAATDLDAEGV